MARTKTCSRCGAGFGCGTDGPTGGCWCDRYPPLFAPDAAVGCMCPQCLHAATLEKVEQYVAGMTPEKALTGNRAKDLPRGNHFVEGIDYYVDGSNWVFSAWHHLRRGFCCQNGCRHCPYGFKKETT